MGLSASHVKVFVRTLLMMTVVTWQSVNGCSNASLGGDAVLVFITIIIIVIITVGDTATTS